MTATKGRASFLGERALGHIDPGSKTCEVAIAAVCDTWTQDRMKKFINDVDTMLRESLDGLVEAHPQLLRVEFEPTFVARREGQRGKVALISGGGSGHEPLHTGFVGRGMLDAACPGQVFTSPTPDQMLAARTAVDAGRGVLFIVKNYAGDGMNFQMASEMLDDRITRRCWSTTTSPSSTRPHTTGRRGVAGTLIVEKIVGAAAEDGADLADCKALGDRVNAAPPRWAWRSPAAPCRRPAWPTFDIGADEMEIGVGIHGEPGRRRVPLMPAARSSRT